MCLRYAFPLLVTFAAASFALRADQDDIENNADLQPTPEETARAAVLKRWPDATEIDAVDMAADEGENADDGDKKMDAEKGNDVADNDDNDMGMNKNDDKDDAGDRTDWTISVLFKSAGKDFEALTDDDGRIQYVYETIPIEKAPQNIVDAARKAIKGDDDDDDGDVIFCQKCSDESKDKPVLTYIVGVGPKDVELDLDGKVLKIKDAPPNAEENDDDGDDMKLRI